MSQSSQMNPQVIAIGGAKGGVGRSIITALTGIALANKGKRVALIDLDLGTSNLHTILGIMQPKKSLEEWVVGHEKNLEVICSPTEVNNLSLISGSASILSPYDLAPRQYESLLKQSLTLEVDYVLIDLGAGIHPHTIDLFNIAGRSLMITSPEPTSIQNTYAFLKAALIRRIEVTLKDHPWLKKILKRTALTKGSSRIRSLGEMCDMLKELDMEVNRQVRTQFMGLKASLIINRAVGDDEIQVVQTLKGICDQRLQFPLKHCLTIPEDKGIQNAIRKLTPFHQLSEEMITKKVVEEWVDCWLLDQPYVALQEEYLMMIDTPSFLSQNTTKQDKPSSKYTQNQPSNSLGTNSSMPALTPTSQLTADALGQSISQLKQGGGGLSLAQFEQALQSQGQQDFGPSTGEFLQQYRANEQITSNYSASNQLDPSYHYVNSIEQDQFVQEAAYPMMNREEDIYDSQAGAYIEPEPIRSVSMEDPPKHEVTSIEEEVRTELGWFHLKTSDLAPFKPVIQTSIYVSGEREVLFEDHYEGIYQDGGYGTQIEKRVERIHHESVKLLQKGGIQLWWEHKQE